MPAAMHTLGAPERYVRQTSSGVVTEQRTACNSTFTGGGLPLLQQHTTKTTKVGRGKRLAQALPGPGSHTHKKWQWFRCSTVKRRGRHQQQQEEERWCFMGATWPVHCLPIITIIIIIISAVIHERAPLPLQRCKLACRPRVLHACAIPREQAHMHAKK